MLDPLIVGLDAGHSPLVQRHDPSVRCPQVRCGHGSCPAQPKHHVCAGMCQPPCRQLKHYMGAGVCPTLRQEPKRHVYAWYTQHTGKQPKRPRLGRPSARWLQPGMRLASVACPTPKPGYQASSVCSTLGAPQPGAWVLQATASPHAPTNSAEQCNPQ